MKIKSLEIKNFRGIRSLTLEMPQIVAICAKNGSGKTSFLDALKFALTGQEPDGEIIRYGSLSTQVEVAIESETGEVTTFTRIKEVDKPSKFKINGKSSTQKSLNEMILSVTGLSVDNIKVLSTGDIAELLKPQEFASLILGYIPEKMTLEKVMSFMPDTTPGMIDIIDANLPVEGIDLTTLDEFDATARSVRKELKANLSAKKLIYDKHIKDKPEATRKELEEKLKVLNDLDNEYKLYLERKKAYETAKENRRKSLEAISALKKEAEDIKATRPDPEVGKRLSEKKSSLEERLLKQRSAINGIASALATLTSTLEAIGSCQCPISPLITCKTDKSVAKQEIEETIEATKESQKAVEDEITSIEDELRKAAEEIKADEENRVSYERKISLAKQVKAMEDALSDEPIEPEAVEKKDVESEKYQLEQAIALVKDYEEGCVLAAQIEKLETEVDDYERLVKALADKGPVRTGVVESYLGVFEDICNERSKAIRPEITFKFKSEAGVKVYMCDANKGTELTVNELSGGEKAYLMYIMIDLLNQLIGAKILMLDELSVMDASTFESLLDLVMRNAGDYDHIILCAVDHKEMVDAFNKREITLTDII